MNKKHLIGYAATALVAMGIGAAGAGSSGTGSSATTASAPPAKTVTLAGAGETVTVTATATGAAAGAAAGAVTTYPGDGTYQVGVDLPPGTYVSAKPDSGNCYWARLKGADGLDDIIANNNSAGLSVVTIKKSDKFFKTDGCNDWIRR